jgi:hypothetical protein
MVKPRDQSGYPFLTRFNKGVNMLQTISQILRFRQILTSFLLGLFLLTGITIFSPMPEAIAGGYYSSESRAHQVQTQPTNSATRRYPNTGSIDDDGKTKQERIEQIADQETSRMGRSVKRTADDTARSSKGFFGRAARYAKNTVQDTVQNTVDSVRGR